jgi:undecaprenyl-phosphate 4-deoxy-4-formamido-L-arabinose transferase
MDDDLQHRPGDLPALVGKAQEGFDVVYADFRKKRQKLWKNLGSWLNGKVAEWVLDKPPQVYLSPFKVIRKEVADLICCYDGPAPYVDGLLFQVTSRITQIPVEHQRRYAGRSTYTFWKSVRVSARLALSFSVKPLRFIAIAGIVFAILGLLTAALVVAYRLLKPEDFPPAAVGWASLMVAVLLVGGVQMIFLGVMGEYAGRTFLRVNNRPQAAIREVLNRTAAIETNQRIASTTKG